MQAFQNLADELGLATVGDLDAYVDDSKGPARKSIAYHGVCVWAQLVT